MSTSSDANLNLDVQLPPNEGNEVKSDNSWTASCSLCSKVFNRHTLLTEHVQSQHAHADDTLVCHVCNEVRLGYAVLALISYNISYRCNDFRNSPMRMLHRSIIVTEVTFNSFNARIVPCISILRISFNFIC